MSFPIFIWVGMDESCFLLRPFCAEFLENVVGWIDSLTLDFSFIGEFIQDLNRQFN